MSRTTLFAGSAALALALASTAGAQTPTPAAQGSGPPQSDGAAAPTAQTASTDPATQDELVVTARRLNEARESIQPSLGATSYGVDNATIQALPGGENQPLTQVVLQLPGVSQDAGGQLHVRDDHNGIQYRLNGIILPEGLSVFGSTLSPRLVGQLNLITGAMPAQYGLRTAGVINLTTKTGAFSNSGEVSLYGGSHGTYEPSFEYSGAVGQTNIFLSGEYRRSELGINNVDPDPDAIHDRTDQVNLFTYVDRILDPDNRVSLIAGYSNQRFQIPNPRGQVSDGTFSLPGVATYRSEDLDERQRESTGFAIASWQHTATDWTLQSSLFTRYSTLTYSPDVTGELLFNGLAQAAAKRDFAAGLQMEGVYNLSDAHTLRGGLIIQGDHSTSDTNTLVFAADPSDPGAPLGDQPLAVADKGARTNWTWSAYLQDEWKLADALTLNYGLRFDLYDAYRSENQLSPRVNLVWTPTDTTTVHVGYARYFTPPPFELVANTTLSAFHGTTGQAPGEGLGDTTPLAERQHYFDVGLEQKVGSRLTLGVDSYYRRSKNLLDEGQFGAPIILTPFNYRQGEIYGVELSANYVTRRFTAYANFSAARAMGRDIVSSQFNFDPEELAYISNHWIHLDHDQTYTASAGASYGFGSGTRVSADMIYGSGLRTEGEAPDFVPNGGDLPHYVQVNMSATQRLTLPKLGDLEARVDLINAFDETYLIRNGSGVGVGAPQYGPRRAVYFGLSKSF